MKRVSIFILLFACAIASAQNSTDVLRYSQDNLQGSARFQGMAGAFGAVGGDLSAMNINPASSAVFSNGLFTVTGTMFNSDNNNSFRNTDTQDFNVDLDINQFGAAMVFNNKNDSSKWDKFVLAFNYDMVSNFDNEIFVNGSNDQGIDNYFLNFAQGLPLGNILLQEGEFIENAYLDIGANADAQNPFADQQAFLGYYGGVIDPATLDEGNTDYNSNAQYSSVNQEFTRNTSGYNSKYTLNAATRFNQKLHLGASLNFHGVIYNQIDFFREDGYDAASPVQFVTFDNFLQTEGAGFSFNAGAIYNINDMIRLGGSYQSPTWYRLEDTFSQRINSDLADDNIDFINFDVVNIFERYTVKTPAKLTGSLALVFGKKGLLSVDYGYQDMSTAQLGPDNNGVFAVANDEIADQFTTVSTLRIGGEYRIARVSLRAGYRYEQSPYVNSALLGDLNSISAGVGIDFGGSRLDIAINRAERETAFNLFDTGVTSLVSTNRINTNLSLGYTFSF